MPRSSPGQTWRWDGEDWAQLSPANAPRNHLDHQMEFDSICKRTFPFADDSDVERYWALDVASWKAAVPDFVSLGQTGAVGTAPSTSARRRPWA